MINKSKAYISPLVLDSIPEIPLNAVKNTYIFSDFLPLEPMLYVVMDKDYVKIENLYKYEEVNDILSIGEDYLIVIKLNARYNYEYLCFKRGNYSWYRAEAKNIVVKYLTENVSRKSLGMVDKIRSVFSRDPMLKRYYENVLDVSLDDETELGSRILEEEETFKSIEHGEFAQVKR